MPHQQKDVISLVMTRLACHVCSVISRVNHTKQAYFWIKITLNNVIQTVFSQNWTSTFKTLKFQIDYKVLNFCIYKWSTCKNMFSFEAKLWILFYYYILCTTKLHNDQMPILQFYAKQQYKKGIQEAPFLRLASDVICASRCFQIRRY